MSLLTTRGILLRSHPYSESSRILRFLTPDHGIVAVIAKGARKRTSKGEGPMETFGQGTLTFAHREGRDLHTLREFERQPGSGGPGGALGLGRDVRRFIGASLIAELILVHTLEEGDPDLYGWVLQAMDELSKAAEEEVPGRILAGAWKVVALLGFPPGLDHCVRCGAPVPSEGLARFDVAAGGLRCDGCAPEEGMRRVGPTARTHLRRLVAGETPAPLPGVSAHLGLLEAFTLHHLAPARRLRGFEMLRPLLPAEGSPPG